MCLFAQEKGFEGAEYSAVKIEKYKSELNRFEESVEIKLDDRKHFEIILNENKIYVVGGCNGSANVYLKSVSAKTLKLYLKCDEFIFTSQKTYSQVLAIDLNTREEVILPEMNFARRYPATILFGKHIYVFGGYDGSRYMNSCER